MKLKTIILALCACSLTSLHAQTAAPEKSASEEKAMGELKAETPVEEKAFKIFDLFESLPSILQSITDEASFTAAENKIEGLIKLAKVEEAALLKLEIPDNAARTKLSQKLKMKEQAMGQKMLPVMAHMQQLDPTLVAKIGPLMQKLGASMNENDASTSKYFLTDEELEQKGK